MKIYAKKSLGQNFLKSEAALNAIIECSNIKETDTILEIGPGTGALTERILKTNCTLIAIEKDDRLIELLTEKFKNYVENKKFILIHDDIMNVDIKKIQNNDFKLIANIPYYLTGAIMRKFVDENLASSMTLLVQDEVAKRIVCRDGKESLLSLSVKSYGDAKYIKKVLAGSFVPAPNVDSAIIHINKHSEPILNENEKKIFFELIHAGFAHKRKTLSHNLKTFDIKLKSSLTDLGLDEKIRAEDVNITTWIKIVHDIM